MTVTHPLAIRNAITDFVVDQLDVNSPPGKLVMQTAAGATVATLLFSNPAFGSASVGTATAAGITDDSNAAGGIIAKAELRQGNNTPIVLCSVTTIGGGGDIQMNSINVTAGQTVKLTSLTYSGPP